MTTTKAAWYSLGAISWLANACRGYGISAFARRNMHEWNARTKEQVLHELIRGAGFVPGDRLDQFHAAPLMVQAADRRRTEAVLGLPRDVEVDVDVPFRSLKVGTQREI